MKMKSLACILLLLVLAAFLPVCSLAAEKPWGQIKVVGYMDEAKRNTCSRMWAPQAVLTSKPHIDDMYLEYRYVKFGAQTRAWQLKLVDEEGHTYPYDDEIDIIFPYPCKWNNDTNSYWKWTKSYADRFQWAYALSSSRFAYEEYDGSYCVAGFFVAECEVGVQKYCDASELGSVSEEDKIECTREMNGIQEEETNNWCTDKKIEQKFLNKTKGFVKIEPNDSYGHRISMRAENGRFPSVCIQTYEITPSYDTKTIEAYVGSFLIWNEYTVTTIKGFTVDTRPKKYRQNPNFWDFLDRHVSTL